MEEKQPVVAATSGETAPETDDHLSSHETKVQTRSADKNSSTSTSKVQMFRRKIWIFQSFVITGVVALCIAQVSTTFRFFGESKEINASVALDIVQEMIQLQAFVVGNIARLKNQKGITYEFLTQSKHTREEVQSFLKQQTDMFNIELHSILNANGELVASAHDQRIGEIFDPNGIVSRLIDSFSSGNTNDSLEYIVEIAEISQVEFANMNLPYFWTSETDAFGESYSLENQKYGLMILACASIVDEYQSLVGVKVLGYVLNGKYEILEKSIKRIGKDIVAGIFFKKGSEWHTSQYLESLESAESRIVDRWDDFDALNSAFNGVKSYGLFTNSEGKKYTYAAASPFKCKYKKAGFAEQEGDRSSAVIVVGTMNLEVDSSMDTTHVALIAFLIGTVLLILLLVIMTFRSFLDPLEKLVKAMKGTDVKNLTEHLVQIERSKHLIWAVALAIFAVSAMIAGMLSYNYQRVTANFDNQSSSYSKLQVVNLFYRRLTSQYFVESRELATSEDFVELVSGNQSAALDDVQNSVNEFVDSSKVNLMFVLDSQKQIVVSSTGSDLKGREFDPKGIVSKVLEEGAAIRANILLNNSEYFSLNPHTFTDSKFLPQRTGKMAATRILAYPILRPNSSTADGVVLIGRIFNANPVSLTVRYVQSYGGCVGIYYIYKNEDPTLVASACKEDEENVRYDVDLTSDGIYELVKRSSTTNGYVSEPSLEILDQKWEVSADRLLPGSEYEEDGAERLSRRFDDSIFIVQFSSRSRWNRLVKTMASISLVTFFGNLLASSVLAFLTFKPIYEFCKRFERKWQPTGKSYESPPVSRLNSVSSSVRGRSENRRPTVDVKPVGALSFMHKTVPSVPVSPTNTRRLSSTTN